MLAFIFNPLLSDEVVAITNNDISNTLKTITSNFIPDGWKLYRIT